MPLNTNVKCATGPQGIDGCFQKLNDLSEQSCLTILHWTFCCNPWFSMEFHQEAVCSALQHGIDTFSCKHGYIGDGQSCTPECVVPCQNGDSCTSPDQRIQMEKVTKFWHPASTVLSVRRARWSDDPCFFMGWDCFWDSEELHRG